ncbi:hypothetical protein SAPIO_CDS2078 [Scedosporium apiospermum]|uniref:Uncharacterized protein n=1 Tax=Pseudallescheria apiosperma TaxID=563466 RepID=A0A084GD71_PSEDA|nr:uncharacterized protein SAPIO_CDS2078 [Scedosporium apiospermum]KEZ45283.1 hypothetical protein SAPIO_CDS2078 [Scedosporium apiospermum]
MLHAVHAFAKAFLDYEAKKSETTTLNLILKAHEAKRACGSAAPSILDSTRPSPTTPAPSKVRIVSQTPQPERKRTTKELLQALVESNKRVEDTQARLAERQDRIVQTQALLSLTLDRLARNQEDIFEVLKEVRDACRG